MLLMISSTASESVSKAFESPSFVSVHGCIRITHSDSHFIFITEMDIFMIFQNFFSREHIKVIHNGYGKNIFLVVGNSFNSKIKKETTSYYFSVASNIVQA